MSQKNWHELDQKYHFNLYKRFPATLERGKGCRVRDTEGNEYIDALAGIAVNSIGHCHPRLVSALKDQVSRLIHISNFFTSEPQVRLEEKLINLTGLDRIFFTNSGAEAVEGAFKVARKYGHQNGKSGKILSLNGAFHGRTLATIATGKSDYQKGFEPMPSGFKQVEFNDIQAIENEMDDNTVAVIIEPIQGEGGIRPVDREYLQQVRRLCDQHGALLILDEIQCGIGRTGYMFANEYYGVKPDILTIAKAMGGGVPIGAVVAREHVANALTYGNHGTTYGGSPLATRAALETLNIIEEEELIPAAAEQGKWFREQLDEWAKEEDAVKEVRGMGLMIGVELNFEAKEVIQKMFKQSVLANAASGKVVRMVPPLTISQVELTAVFIALKDAVKQVKAEKNE